MSERTDGERVGLSRCLYPNTSVSA